jgi:hypothetical protein
MTVIKKNIGHQRKDLCEFPYGKNVVYFSTDMFTISARKGHQQGTKLSALIALETGSKFYSGYFI